jgi:transcriptional regulator with GAF, ATPase, and Fis domain
MDKNVFFREATLRIGSDLAIEKSLYSTLTYLRQVMPADWMAIEHYDENVNAMRTIAIVDGVSGKSVDLVTPLSEDAQQQAVEKYDAQAQDVYLLKNPLDDKLAREMLDFHGIEATSLLVLPLGSGERKIGTLAMASLDEDKFTTAHADLISLLSQPFAMALSNTLKHRNELRLFDRDFFWEMTKRICGNLEIEEGLRSCIEYLSEFMPADTIYLERYDDNFGSVRCFARATPEKGEKIDIMIPLPGEAKEGLINVIKGVQEGRLPSVFVNNRSQDIPFSKLVLETLNEPSSSILSLTLLLGDEIAGALTLIAEGDDRFKEKHANLFATLQMPFFVAMSNTLKHREILKLKELLTDDNRYLHSELRRISGDEIVGANFGLREVMEKVRQVAKMDSPVLLLGETGVGKDVIANAIHYLSARNEGPFVSVNCGAIPDTLIDSELFGHEKGAFTGALAQKRGRFERAEKGTIFLDEIGELPLQAQVRLLKVLQTKEIERVGGIKTIPLDIRIIAATNRKLEEMVKLNQFREDLWFRLNVFPIWIPPLRDRRSDIPALLQHFLSLKSRELKLPAIPTVSPGVTDVLMNYHWPGNVRELQNVVERELIVNPKGPLTFSQMNISTQHGIEKQAIQHFETDNLDEVTSIHIRNVLKKTNGKIHGKCGAADLLGINASTLRNRMNKLEIKYGREKRA